MERGKEGEAKAGRQAGRQEIKSQHSKPRETPWRDLQVKDTGLLKFSILFKNTLFTPITKSMDIIYSRTLLIKIAE